MQQAVRTLAALALTTALAAPAMVLANKSGNDFAKMDTDQDGRISATEHSAQLEQKFARLDSDGNGSISQSELSAKGKADRFAKLDSDSNGELSRQEFTGREHFAQMDTDADGFLSRDEVENDAMAMSGDDSMDDADSTAQDWE